MLTNQLSEWKGKHLTWNICWFLCCKPTHKGWFPAPTVTGRRVGKRCTVTWASRPGALLRPGTPSVFQTLWRYPQCLEPRLTHTGCSINIGGTAFQESWGPGFWKLLESCCLSFPVNMQGGSTSFLGRMFIFPVCLFLVNGHWPDSVLT